MVIISVGELAIMDTISVFEFLLRSSEVSGFEDAHFQKLLYLHAVCVALANLLLFVYQVLGANFVALAWNVILSFKAHKEVIAK